MKKIRVLALILFAAVSSFAQEKTIDKTEFDKIYKSSFRFTINQPYRETEISESTIEFVSQTNVPANLASTLPTPHIVTKTISEYSPTGGFHTIYESNSAALNMRKEAIMLAKKFYTREGNGQWTEAAIPVRVPHEALTQTVDKQIEYKFLGSEFFNDQTTNVYAQIEKSKIISLTGNRESALVATTKYWFTEDGKLLKRESNREIRNEKSIGKFNSVRTYEIDPSIKIEAPNVSLAK